MYKLSYEKCLVCFVFLVMVAFLSCTGFRIDNVAAPMTDYHSSNKHSANATHQQILPIIDNGRTGGALQNRPALATAPPWAQQRQRRIQRYLDRKYGRHRIRHSKKSYVDALIHQQQQQQQQQQQLKHLPQEERYQKNNKGQEPQQRYVRTTASTTVENLAQIPAYSKPARPTEAIVMRSQRSPYRKQRNKSCQEQDVARKAYDADTVVLAKAESMSSNRIRNYSVSFRILKHFKAPPYAVDDTLRLTFLNDTKRINCESELRGSNGLVKAQIEQSMKYYLFLNSHGNHNYTVLGMPVLWRADRSAKIDRVLDKVTRSNFEPRLKEPILNVTDNRPQLRAKVRLVCKVRGFPIPVITWKKNDSFLHGNNNTRIIFVNRGRKSTLVIKSAREADSGHYYCIARGVTGETKNAIADIKIDSNDHGEECTGKHKEEFCYNGGKCYNITQLSSLHCVCPEGFSGERCGNKVPSNRKYLNDTAYININPNCSALGIPANVCSTPEPKSKH